MARFAEPFVACNFATGMMHYDDTYPREEQSSRLVLTVTVGNRFTVPAIVDTGAPWCILDPEIVEQLRTAILADYTPDEILTVRGTPYKGKLLRVTILLHAEQGGSLEVDATVFVPTLQTGDTWTYPNFIGLDGFLNRIRFAVDPGESTFYFGAI